MWGGRGNLGEGLTSTAAGLPAGGLVRNVCAGLQADGLEFYVRFKREEIRLAIHPLGPMLGPRAEVLV